MTKRAIILGFLGVVAICGLSYLNNTVLSQTALVGNNFPVSVYGALIVFVVLINPLFKKWGLTNRELAVVLALTLAGSAIPGAFRCLIPSMVMPHHHNQVQSGWRPEKVVESLPSEMLVDVPDDAAHDEVVSRFRLGSAHDISLSDVPWWAWVRPLLTWLPLLMTLWVALIGLSVMVHRQWSEHEKLPYPIAKFTDAILPKEGESLPTFMRHRGFWIATGIVCFIHLNNYTVTWFPEYGIKVPTAIDFTSLGELFPLLVKGGGKHMLYFKVYFVIIGMAYFIPKEASLSFGIGPILWYLLMGVAVTYGVDLSASQGSGYFSMNPQSFARFGANLGVFALIAYNGRQFYLATARRAVGLTVKSEVDADPASIWGMRVFMIAVFLLVGQFLMVGIDLFVAIPFILIMIIGFLVMGRVIAETGLVYMKCYFWPCAILWGTVGLRTVGPQQMLVMMMVTTMLFMDPRESLLPFMTNSLKVLEDQKVNIKKPAAWCIAALVIGVAVALPVTLYLSYQHGSGGDPWANSASTATFNNAVDMNHRLASVEVTVDESSSILSRLGDLRPDWKCIGMATAALALVVAFSIASTRIPKWPLHPLMFVVWSSTPLRHMGPAYLMGWALKAIIVRYGGAKVYERVKPIMCGLIAGEILGAVLPMLYGAIHFYFTGEAPVPFRILP